MELLQCVPLSPKKAPEVVASVSKEEVDPIQTFLNAAPPSALNVSTVRTPQGKQRGGGHQAEKQRTSTLDAISNTK